MSYKPITYEKRILSDIINSQQDITVYRGGAKSGKSSLVSHISEFAATYCSNSPEWKNVIRYNTFLKVISFESVPEELTSLHEDMYPNESRTNLKYMLNEHLAPQLKQGFINDLPDPHQKDRFYQLLKDALLDKDLCSRNSAASFNVLRENIERYCYLHHKLDIESCNTQIIKDAYFDITDPEIKVVACLLPFIMLGKLAKSKGMSFCLVMDNLDPLRIELQQYLYLTFVELYKSNIQESGLSIVLFFRHGTFSDPRGRFSEGVLRSHLGPSPSDLIFVKATDFLTEPSFYFYDFPDLTDSAKEFLLKRFFSLWYHLLDEQSDFSNIINAMSGTNLQYAYVTIQKWLLSDRHPKPKIDYRIDDKIKDIVLTVTAARLLTYFATSVARGIGELFANKYEPDELKDIDLSDHLVEHISKIIIDICTYCRLAKKVDEEKYTPALRCFVGQKLRGKYNDILSHESQISMYIHSVTHAFAYEIKDKYDVDGEFARNLSNLFSKINTLVSDKVQAGLVEQDFEESNLTVQLCNLIGDCMLATVSDDVESRPRISSLMRKRHGSSAYVGLVDKDVNADFILSYHKASELLLIETSNTEDLGQGSTAVNLFSVNGAELNPVGLQILYLLSTETNGSCLKVGAIKRHLIAMGHDDNDINNVLADFIGNDKRIIYSSTTDHIINPISFRDSETINLYLSWIGRNYYDLVKSPVYLQWAFDGISDFKKNITEYENRSSIYVLQRLAYTLECFKKITKLEVDRIRLIPHLTKVPVNCFMLDTMGVEADVFISSAYNFFSTLDYFFKSKNFAEKNNVTKLAKSWVDSMERVKVDLEECFGKKSDEWEYQLDYIKYSFAELLK